MAWSDFRKFSNASNFASYFRVIEEESTTAEALGQPNGIIVSLGDENCNQRNRYRQFPFLFFSGETSTDLSHIQAMRDMIFKRTRFTFRLKKEESIEEPSF